MFTKLGLCLAYAAKEDHGRITDFNIGLHWHRLEDYDPLICDDIAWHYPNQRMVGEPVGGWYYYRQGLAVITKNAHCGNPLDAGIATVFAKEQQRFSQLGPEGVSACRWQIGSDLLI